MVTTMLPNGAILRSVAAEVTPAMAAYSLLCVVDVPGVKSFAR